MRNKLKVLVMSVAMSISLSLGSMLVQAGEQTDNVRAKLNQAVQNKTFYNYMMAYIDILSLPQDQQGEFLDKLAPIFSEANTPAVQKARTMLESVAKDRNGRIYAETEAYLSGLTDKEMDAFTKGYLLGELTSWGRQFVFTPDYIKAVDSLIRFGEYKDTYKTALDAINNITNNVSKEYLLGELANYKKAKDAIEEKFYSRVGQENAAIIKKLIASVGDETIVAIRENSRNKSISLKAERVVKNSLFESTGFIVNYNEDVKLDTMYIQNIAVLADAKSFTSEYYKLFTKESQEGIDNHVRTMINDTNYTLENHSDTITNSLNLKEEKKFIGTNEVTDYAYVTHLFHTYGGILSDLIYIFIK